MKHILLLIIISLSISSPIKELKIYKDECGAVIKIWKNNYYFESNGKWSKGTIVYLNDLLTLNGVTIYDTITTSYSDTLESYSKINFRPIISLDTNSNRTHNRDVSLIAVGGGQLDSFIFELKVLSDSVFVRTDKRNNKCDTFKLKTELNIK